MTDDELINKALAEFLDDECDRQEAGIGGVLTEEEYNRLALLWRRRTGRDTEEDKRQP